MKKPWLMLILAGCITCSAFALTACDLFGGENSDIVQNGGDVGGNQDKGDVGGGKDDNGSDAEQGSPEAHVHALERHAANAASCLEGGNIEYWSCSGCEKNFSDKNGTQEVKEVALDALGHDLQNRAAQPATCTEAGWDAYELCSRCDYTTYKEISAKGHTEVTDEAVAATCQQTGKTEGKYCADCNQTLVAQEEIPKTGHKWSGGSCIVCGNKIVYTEGLSFELSEDGSYAILTGLGDATDTDIYIPESYLGKPVKVIGLSAFFKCDIITSVYIPEGVTEIGDSVFSQCENLESITIPASLESIGEQAFYSCTKLLDFYYGGTAEQWKEV